MDFVPSLGPFAAEGGWYKGCLHLHTTASDGRMPPDRVVEHYTMGGYDFLAVTDHEKVTDTSGLGGPEFLVIPGIEIGVGRGLLGQRYHVVGIGLDRPIERSSEMSAAEAVAAIQSAGGEAIVAHPYWSGLIVDDLAAIPGRLVVEVFNTTCEVAIGRGNSQVHWDDLLSRGRLALAVAVDDCHRPGFDSLLGWTVIRAPELTRAAIVGALRQGHFYASTGPEIYSVSIQDDSLEVECSPVISISMISDPSKGGRVAAGTRSPSVRGTRLRGRQVREGMVDGQLIVGARFSLGNVGKYVRIQVTDERGRTAWTNPVIFRA